MREIKKRDLIVYQCPEKRPGKTVQIEVGLYKVREVFDDETFTVDEVNGKLKKFRVKFIFEPVEYEGFDMQKIAIEEGYLDPKLLEKIQKSKKEMEDRFKEIWKGE